MLSRNRSFVAGLVIGLTAGLTAGLVGVAQSATGKKAWDRFGDMFQGGYVAGFLDCVRLAKVTDFEGYIATNFVIPPGTKPTHFQAWIDKAYQDPKNAERTLPQMLVLAGYKLQGQFGPEPPVAANPSLEALRSVIESRRAAAREAADVKKVLEDEKAADAKAAAAKSATAPPEAGVETAPGEVPPAK